METRELKKIARCFPIPKSVRKRENESLMLSTIRIEQKEKMLSLVRFDSDKLIEVRISNDEPDCEPIFVNKQELLESIRKIKDKRVQFQVEVGRIIIKSKNSIFKILQDRRVKDYLSEQKLPIDSHLSRPKLSINSSFIEKLKNAMTLIYPKHPETALRNIYLGENQLIASDGFNLSVSQVSSLSKPILIPFKAAKNIVKLFSKIKAKEISLTRFGERGEIFADNTLMYFTLSYDNHSILLKLKEHISTIVFKKDKDATVVMPIV